MKMVSVLDIDFDEIVAICKDCNRLKQDVEFQNKDLLELNIVDGECPFCHKDMFLR